MLRSLSAAVRTMATSAAKNGKRLVWVDCEMTGLDHEKQTLVEIAVLVTDEQLNIIAEGPDIVINQSETVLQNMEEWPRKTFEKNGLLQKIRDSTIGLQQAEDMVLEFLKQQAPKGECPLAGNSVYVDRSFIRKYMPQVDDYLHYRIVDVSSIKELARRWYPQEFDKAPRKRCTHRALDDIKESIEELKYYRSSIFKS